MRATGEGHRVTNLELFFDLVFVFVFAFTQVNELVAEEESGRAALRGILLIAILWWAWCSYAWLGNQARADEGVLRAALIVAMAAVFAASMAIPEAWHDRPGGLSGPMVLAVAIVVVRGLHLIVYAVAAGGDAGLRRQLARNAAPMAVLVAEHSLHARTGVQRIWLARATFNYLHFPLVVGVLTTALALKLTVEEVTEPGHSLTEVPHTLPAVCLGLGPALYLLALSAIRWRNIGRPNVGRLVAAAVLLALIPALRSTPALGALGLTAAVLVGLIIIETVRNRHLRDALRHRDTPSTATSPAVRRRLTGERRRSEPALAAEDDVQDGAREQQDGEVDGEAPSLTTAGKGHVLAEEAGDEGRDGDHRGPPGHLLHHQVEPVALDRQVRVQHRGDHVTEALRPLRHPQDVVADVLVVRHETVGDEPGVMTHEDDEHLAHRQDVTPQPDKALAQLETAPVHHRLGDILVEEHVLEVLRRPVQVLHRAQISVDDQVENGVQEIADAVRGHVLRPQSPRHHVGRDDVRADLRRHLIG